MSGANCRKHGPYYPAFPGCPECGKTEREGQLSQILDRLAALETTIKDIADRLLAEGQGPLTVAEFNRIAEHDPETDCPKWEAGEPELQSALDESEKVERK